MFTAILLSVTTCPALCDGAVRRPLAWVLEANRPKEEWRVFLFGVLAAHELLLHQIGGV